ncbi:MAG: hypothetical protein KGI26_04880 [Thaumarchaeota archaeon]|nr:hypothetical protein [Nitrososphaerota archaeon]
MKLYLHKRVRAEAVYAGQTRLKPPAYRKAMVLLTDVRIYGEVLADHVWLEVEGFDITGFKRGDRVKFTARVDVYVKGYLGRDEDGIEGVQEEDLKLARPLDFRNATTPEQGQATIESTLTTWRERGH